MYKLKLNGIFTALITPFINDKIDYNNFKKFVSWQLQNGVSGLVCCGTTGEGNGLTFDEKKKLLNICLEEVTEDKNVILGINEADTKNTVMAIQQFSEAPIVMISPPSYIKPTQEGIYLHYKHIYEETGAPLIVYNIPSRNAVNIEDDTLKKILTLPNIVAVKETINDISRAYTIIPNVLLSGDDMMNLALYTYGASGTISVASNLVPDKMVAIYNAIINNDIKTAMDINNKLIPLYKLLSKCTNPIMIKYALSNLKNNNFIINNILKLPMVPYNEGSIDIEQIMRNIYEI